MSVFRSLKVLEIDGAVKLKFKQKDIPDNIFPVLEELRFASGDTSVLKLFTLFECVSFFSARFTAYRPGLTLTICI